MFANTAPPAERAGEAKENLLFPKRRAPAVGRRTGGRAVTHGTGRRRGRGAGWRSGASRGDRLTDRGTDITTVNEREPRCGD